MSEHPLFAPGLARSHARAAWLSDPENAPLIVALFVALFVAATLATRSTFALWDTLVARCARRPDGYVRSGSVLLAPFHEFSFWESEYSSGQAPFEWYVAPTLVHEQLSRHVSPQQSVLYLGCGTSGLGRYLRERLGVASVTAVDSSATALTTSRARALACDHARMDATRLALRDGSFDLVVDKGTLDSIACGGEEGAVRLLLEARRVLRPGGEFVLITTLNFESSRTYLNRGMAGMAWSAHYELPTAHPEWEGRRKNEMYVFRKPEA